MSEVKYPLLAIETTGSFASVALKDAEGKVHNMTMTEKLNHLKGLLPLIDYACGAAKIDIKEVKNIAVSQGPGSFTGIRIGISTVRSIAQITGAKVIGVPTQEAFVYNNPAYGGIVCPIFDARMEQMYAGAFVLNDNKIQNLVKTDAYAPQEYFARLEDLLKSRNQFDPPLDFKFFGDGLPVFKEDIIHWSGRMAKNYFAGFSYTTEEENPTQLATSVLKWADNFGTPIDYTDLYPVYIRKAEAQRRLDEKNACRE